jgi:hypothetical protein
MGIDTTVLEPSASDTIGRVTQGRVIITTNELATGTSMIYLTPESEVRVRGREVVIAVTDRGTTVTLLHGDVTITPLNAPAGEIGTTLHSGQLATITSTAAGAGTVQVVTLSPSQTNEFATQVASAQRAQQTVIFETVTTSSGGTNTATDIQAKAIVPVDLPVHLTVSPATLRTGG